MPPPKRLSKIRGIFFALRRCPEGYLAPRLRLSGRKIRCHVELRQQSPGKVWSIHEFYGTLFFMRPHVSLYPRRQHPLFHAEYRKDTRQAQGKPRRPSGNRHRRLVFHSACLSYRRLFLPALLHFPDAAPRYLDAWLSASDYLRFRTRRH